MAERQRTTEELVSDLIGRAAKLHSHYGDNAPEIAMMREAAARLEHLQGIVDRLPVTADYKRVTPDDPFVYDTDGERCMVVWDVDSGMWAAPDSDLDERIMVASCFSTEQAARAAAAEGRDSDG